MNSSNDLSINLDKGNFEYETSKTTSLKHIDISDHLDEINALINKLVLKYKNVENPIFLENVAIYAHNLPLILRKELLMFKLKEDHAVFHITGFKIDNDTIGPTQTQWLNRTNVSKTLKEDFYLALCSHVIGEMVAWATEQAGNLIHEVFPIKGNAGGQLGTSTDKLDWHTETAFHSARMDYLVLLALRNNDKVATTYASVDDLDLDDTTIKSLSLPSYPFLPDEGNRIDKDLSPDETGLIADLIRDSHNYVHRILEKPEKLPVLFGSKKAPYLRIHPHYIADFSDDSSSYKAFNNLKSEINACINDIVLQPGDLLFIDNFKAVHGRKEIPGHFDGTDRWFKRGFITRDLRKSREFRVSSSSRTIY